MTEYVCHDFICDGSKKTDKGTGVKVKIKTPENITLVTAEQYANAAITAGVTDAEIEVAAVSKVTGESALTGVYKAFEANGYNWMPNVPKWRNKS